MIGAGPGGYAAAFYAADLGMKVTLIDNEKNPGGVCLYRGCIPSKALLHVAKLLDESKHAKEWGIEFGEPKIDVNKLRDFKNRVVDKLTSGTGQVSKLRKVNYIQGWASIVDPKTIKVAKNGGGEETVSVDYMILALGIAADEDSGADQRLAARAGFDRRARSAGSAEVDAGDRRRLHRPRARLGVCGARHAACRSSR